jgi:hypothetical protein
MKPDFIPGAAGGSRRQEGDKVFITEMIQFGRIELICTHSLAYHPLWERRQPNRSAVRSKENVHEKNAEHRTFDALSASIHAMQPERDSDRKDL